MLEPLPAPNLHRLSFWCAATELGKIGVQDTQALDQFLVSIKQRPPTRRRRTPLKNRRVRRVIGIGCGTGILLTLAACATLIVDPEGAIGLVTGPPVCTDAVYATMREHAPAASEDHDSLFGTVGRFAGGEVGQLLIGESDAFAPMGTELVWLDFSQPESPIEKAYYRFGVPPTLLAIDPDRPAVTVGVGPDLWLVDFSDPQSPAATHLYNAPDSLVEAIIVDNQAYMRVRSCTYLSSAYLMHGSKFCQPALHKVDLSSEQFADSPTRCYPYPLGALLAGFVSISNPTRATTGGYQFASAGPEGIIDRRGKALGFGDEVWRIDRPDGQAKIEVMGDHAYLAQRRGSLYVVDVSRPSRPTQVAVYDRSADYLDLAHADGPYLYAISDSGARLEMLDVSSPDQPLAVHAIEAETGFRQVEFSQGRLYVLTDTSEVLVLDASSLQTLGALPADTSDWIRSFAISGTTLYALWERRGEYEYELRIIDLASPATPQLLSANPIARPLTIQVADDTAVIGLHQESPLMVDVSRPKAPRFYEASADAMSSSFHEVALSGRSAYFLSTNSKSLTVVRFADPGHVEVVGTYQHPGYASDISASEDYFYIVEGRGGLWILSWLGGE